MFIYCFYRHVNHLNGSYVMKILPKPSELIPLLCQTCSAPDMKENFQHANLSLSIQTGDCESASFPDNASAIDGGLKIYFPCRERNHILILFSSFEPRHQNDDDRSVIIKAEICWAVDFVIFSPSGSRTLQQKLIRRIFSTISQSTVGWTGGDDRRKS